jgi:hypothetical protein
MANAATSLFPSPLPAHGSGRPDGMETRDESGKMMRIGHPSQEPPLPTSYFNIWFPAAVMACLFFAYLATLAIDHLQARHWPQTTGKIVESAVEEVTHETFGRMAFRPCIRFTYHAAGRPRESRHFAFHSGTGSRAQAEATIARYPVGSTVTVYHHPDRPEQAVVDTGHAGLSVAVAALAGLLVVGMIVTWWSVSRVAG